MQECRLPNINQSYIYLPYFIPHICKFLMHDIPLTHQMVSSGLSYAYHACCKFDMWQSQIEIKYSIAYFERITKFDAL